MTDQKLPPQIKSIEWGEIEVENATGVYKDAKIYPSGSREWDWNETGTRHNPGIQRADVEELVEKGATEIVLTRGFRKRLQVKEETLQWLKEQGIEVHVLETGEAAELFNQLASEKSVGGLFHSTC